MHRQDIIYYSSAIKRQCRFNKIKMLNIAFTWSCLHLEIHFISDVRNQVFACHLRIEFYLELVTS